MQQLKEAQLLNDYWLRIFGIPLVALVATLTFSAPVWINNHSMFWKTFLISAVTAVLTWESCRIVLIFVRKKFPELKQTSERVFYSYLFYLFDCILVTGIVFVWYKAFDFWGYPVGLSDWLKNLFTCYSFVALLAFIYEAVYYYRMWSNSILETEELKRTGMQSQLDSLKNQISPHFLFNSLNVLSSLVEEDLCHAEQYVNELARVYQYVLKSNRSQLIPLAEELDFIDAYSFLLQTRFGDNLKVQATIPAEQKHHLVPPLSLQMLVENAVKHNIVSSAKPLCIRIESNEEQMLKVSNNLQRKTQLIKSNHVGLNNIKERYRMLARKEVTVNESDAEFSVFIPLIAREEVSDEQFFTIENEYGYAEK